MATITRSLPCRLTKDELADRIKQMGQVSAELNRLEAESSEQKAKLKELTACIKDSVRAQRELAGAVGAGEESRAVKCFAVADAASGRVVISRDDTGEVVEERAMTADEKMDAKQGRLFEAEQE